MCMNATNNITLYFMMNYDFLRMFLFCLDDNVCNFHKNDEFFSEGVKLSLSNNLISLPNLIIRWWNPTCNYFISKNNNNSIYVAQQFSENFLFPLSFGWIKLNWWIRSSGFIWRVGKLLHDQLLLKIQN